MKKTFAVIAALAMAAPAAAQNAPTQAAPVSTAPAQSWTVMSDHTLDMPSQGAHSRSRPWLKAEAAAARKGAKAKRSG